MGIIGIFLIMGNAGFISSTVVLLLRLRGLLGSSVLVSKTFSREVG